MRFLVDAQLPPALARRLVDQGYAAQHVADVEMMRATDAEIWAYAGKISATLITKDEDFTTLLAARPNGVAVVWVRVGNTSRRALLDWFARAMPDIEKLLKAGESLIELVE